jgi:uncharacterized membrane protein (DUF485 family)
VSSQSTQGVIAPRQESTRISGRFIMILLVLVIVLVLGLLGAIGYTVYLVATRAAPEVTAAVVVAFGTILVAVLTYITSRAQHERSVQQERQYALEQAERERQSALEQAQRDQRAEIYAEFMRFWFRMFTAERSAPVNLQEREEHLNQFSQKLIAWGSDNFLRAYLDFRTTIVFEEYEAFNVEIDEPGNVKRIRAFEEVLFTIRSDLGYRKEELQPGVLLGMFLKDEDVRRIMQSSERGNAELPPAGVVLPKEGKSHEHV